MTFFFYLDLQRPVRDGHNSAANPRTWSHRETPAAKCPNAPCHPFHLPLPRKPTLGSKWELSISRQLVIHSYKLALEPFHHSSQILALSNPNPNSQHSLFPQLKILILFRPIPASDFQAFEHLSRACIIKIVKVELNCFQIFSRFISLSKE